MNQLAHGRTKAFPQGEGPSEDGQREEGQQNANTRADDLLSQEHDERTAAYAATVPGLWARGLPSVRWDLVVGLFGAFWRQL